MNCLEFRRVVGADPSARGEGGAEHRAECIGCAAFLRDQQRLTERLRGGAVLQVPAGLEKRVLLRHRIAQTGRRRLIVAASGLAAAMLVVALACAF